MSTHGILGFVLDEQEKFSEIGGDAYLSGAGVDYLQWLRAVVPGGDVTDLVPYVRRLKLVDAEASCMPSSIGLISGLMDDAAGWPLTTANGDTSSVGVDRRSFAVYEEFQKVPHTDGRFAHRSRY